MYSSATPLFPTHSLYVSIFFTLMPFDFVCTSLSYMFYTFSLVAVAKSLRCYYYYTRPFLYVLLLFFFVCLPACLPGRSPVAVLYVVLHFRQRIVEQVDYGTHTVKRYDVC